MLSLFPWIQSPPAFRNDLRIEGERLYLRPRVMSDDTAMFGYLRDADVIRFLPWETAPSVQAIRPMLAESIEQRKRCEALGLAIILRETDAMIGQTDLMDLKSVRGNAELGYVVAQEHWGQGLMTEAAQLVTTCGFESLKLKRIIAYADSDNYRSRHVLEKIGMRLTSVETRLVKGEQRPYVRYELARTDWEAAVATKSRGKQVSNDSP